MLEVTVKVWGIHVDALLSSGPKVLVSRRLNTTSLLGLVLVLILQKWSC